MRSFILLWLLAFMPIGHAHIANHIDPGFERDVDRFLQRELPHIERHRFLTVVEQMPVITEPQHQQLVMQYLGTRLISEYEDFLRSWETYRPTKKDLDWKNRRARFEALELPASPRRWREIRMLKLAALAGEQFEKGMPSIWQRATLAASVRTARSNLMQAFFEPMNSRGYEPLQVIAQLQTFSRGSHCDTVAEGCAKLLDPAHAEIQKNRRMSFLTVVAEYFKDRFHDATSKARGEAVSVGQFKSKSNVISMEDFRRRRERHGKR